MTSTGAEISRQRVHLVTHFGHVGFALVALLGGCDCDTTTGQPEVDGGATDGMVVDGDTSDAADGGAGCTQSADCTGANQLCLAPTCVLHGGDCTNDEDCSGDRYCCSGDCLPTGETQGKCISYGVGPRGTENLECEVEVKIGVFEADVQCEWTGPPEGDTYPDHFQVLSTPLVADTPHDSGPAVEILAVSYNHDDGSASAAQGTDPNRFGVLRILHGQTCAQLESVHDPDNRIIAASPPAVADLDRDGNLEIVAHRAGGGLVAFRWSEDNGRYERYWATPSNSTYHWNGPSIHDLDDDGFPEVLSASREPTMGNASMAEVYDGRTGAIIARQEVVGAYAPLGITPVAGDLDGNGTVELVARDVWSWDMAKSEWVTAFLGPTEGVRYAFADFGTDGADAATFDFSTPDGIAEVVTTGGNLVTIVTLDGDVVLRLTGIAGGGPPTVGDFDADGRPEVALASRNDYRVVDPDCVGSPVPDGCQADGVRWSQPSQDFSSSVTGSSLFDFEGDGQTEAVYADECFTRIYDGATGEVLYSAYRASCTWYENPIMSDPDRDTTTEIIVGSNSDFPGGAGECSIVCPEIDPIHRGVKCETGADCISGSCDEGYCRCADNDQCDTDYRCQAPPDGTPGTGNTCRAYHPPRVLFQTCESGDDCASDNCEAGICRCANTIECSGAFACASPPKGTPGSTAPACHMPHPDAVRVTGVRVLRDRLDRWASSRSIWNQHAYSVTNINDDGTVPRTSEWAPNFTSDGLNNYRQNVQGSARAGTAPDITGRLDPDRTCKKEADRVDLEGVVCNRGSRTVGAAMPAAFYEGDPETGTLLCVAYTEGPVPVGECLPVSCELTQNVEGTITMVTNDDGEGGRTTLECNTENNNDSTEIEPCIVVI